MSTGNHCRVTRIHITYIFARAQDFPPWAFIKHLLQTQQVQKRHCQGFSSQGGLREWMKSACLWDAHNVVAAEWWWAGAGGGWGVRQCFLMEVSPARYQFPFTKCQGSSPVIDQPQNALPHSQHLCAIENLCDGKTAWPFRLSAGGHLRRQQLMFLCGQEKIEAKRNEVASPLVPTLLIFLFSKPLWRKWDLISSGWTQLLSSSNSLHIFPVLPFSFLLFPLIFRKGSFLPSFKFSFIVCHVIFLSRGFAFSNWKILEQEGWKVEPSPVSPMVPWKKFSNKVRKVLHLGLKEERVFKAFVGGWW